MESITLIDPVRAKGAGRRGTGIEFFPRDTTLALTGWCIGTAKCSLLRSPRSQTILNLASPDSVRLKGSMSVMASLLQLYPACFIQHAVAAVAISQIQSDGQSLLRNIPALLAGCGANLLHCRSPLIDLCFQAPRYLGSVQQPVGDRPSHLI